MPKEEKNKGEKATQSISAENVDAGNQSYHNCVINNFNIDHATFENAGNKLPGQMTKEIRKDPEELQRDMINYISSVTNFAPEMVERVLQTAENFMKNQFGLE